MGCALDQDNVIDHDRTHDEAMTGDDDEPLSCPHRPQGKLDTDWRSPIGTLPTLVFDAATHA